MSDISNNNNNTASGSSSYHPLRRSSSTLPHSNQTASTSPTTPASPSISSNRNSVIGNLNNWINDLNIGLFQSFTFSNINPFRRRSSKSSGTVSGTVSPTSSPVTDAVSLSLHKNLLLEFDSEKSPAKFLNGSSGGTIKPKEVIELANFGVVEVDNWEKGVGHNFQPHELRASTWCDCCSEFLWSPVIYDLGAKPSLSTTVKVIQCANCKYTCHTRCRKLVRIDCQGTKETPTTGSKEPEEIRCPSPIFRENSDLCAKLEIYNDRLKHRGSGLGMTILDDGCTFRGFFRVHLNLTRPINVVAGTRPPSIYDIINEEEPVSRRTLTSFYMPRDTVKNIHITSENTSLEVIKAMLKKFKVVDNPQKFALYQKYFENEQLITKRIGDFEKPLQIALDWWDSDEKKFVLQENDTGDIAWDAFLIPELKNFLKILDREEKDHLEQVRLKYEFLRPELERLITLKTIQSEGFVV